MRVYAMTPGGDKFKLEVEGTDTFADVRDQIMHQTGLEAHQIRLMFKT